MKRTFFVSVAGGTVGFILALLLLNFTNSASALSLNRSAVVQAPASIVSAPSAAPISSTFTYQGQLKNGSSLVNGSCDMAFRLYDDPGTGNLIGSPITTTVPINNGLFTAGLNFGSSAFAGEARWLDIRVRCPAGSGSYTALTPRQSLTPAPYALAFGARGGVYGYMVPGTSPGPYPTIGFNTYGTYPYLAGVTGYGGVFQFQDGEGTLRYYPGSYASAGAAHSFDTTPSFAITNNGNVGVGTDNPLTVLHVKGSTASSGNNTAVFENPAIGPYASAIHYGTYGDWYIRSASGFGKVVIQDTGGNVGIGTTSPQSRLEVWGASAGGGDYALWVANSNGDFGLAVSDNRRVAIGALDGSSTIHACYNNFLSFAACSSAAEYVPTIDSGLGLPETADLVSIAPGIKNPYGDTHSPFTVQKSTTACDANLLGFITNPEKGADGEKRNEHYLPLAIYGYFPAKVTLENGAIHRGDPLTSSSKPGYAMKATQACKIIGYALEDADHEGTIQVFAHLSENAAPEVASLRAQVQELKAQNAAFEARLTALEKAMQAGGSQ